MLLCKTAIGNISEKYFWDCGTKLFFNFHNSCHYKNKIVTDIQMTFMNLI